MNKYKIILLVFVISLSFVFSLPKFKVSNNVTTIIDEDDNRKISINFPTTDIEKIDNKVKKYINKIYNKFMNGSNEELNIDYKFNILNNKFISIVIISTIDKNVTVKAFVFHKKTFKLLSLNDIIDKNSVSNNFVEELNKNGISINLIYQNNNFYFDDNYLHIILNTKQNNSFTDIPIDLEIIGIDQTITSITRKNIEFPYKVIDPTKKSIALTFDDGPTKYTKKIIQTLEKYDANATFFIIGNKVEIYKDTLLLMLKNGNEIGNHSYNHKWFTKLDDEEIIYQINETQNIIKEKLNYEPKIIRFPYGASNNKIKSLTTLEIVKWTLDPQDWHAKSSKYIANNIIDSVKDGDIIILHDSSKKTLDSLEIFIPKLISQGYNFVTVSELNKIVELRKNLAND